MKRGILASALLLIIIFFTACGDTRQEPGPYLPENDLQSTGVGNSVENSAWESGEAGEQHAGDSDISDAGGAIADIQSRLIAEQSFPVKLEEWGEVTFAAYNPQETWEQDAEFRLLQNGEEVFLFPGLGAEGSNTRPGICFCEVKAVAFKDCNADGCQDIYIINEYAAGAAPEDASTYREVRVYVQPPGKREFEVEQGLTEYLNSHGANESIREAYLETFSYLDYQDCLSFAVDGKNDALGSSLRWQLVQKEIQSIYYEPWTEEAMTAAVNERSEFYRASAYYDEVMDYLENVREVRDISNVAEPLFYTDMMIYTQRAFENVPPVVIHLAKNEIYARRGYIFQDEDLQNYFSGCIWYQPACEGKDFDDSVFNDYERINLMLLSELDTYKK